MVELRDTMIVATVPVTNIEQAKRFYGEKLGLNLCDENKERGELLYEAAGGTHLLVYQRATPTRSDNTALAFLVNDVEMTVQDLKNKGITFEEYNLPGLKTQQGIASIDGEKSAWFKDPEGNILAIAQSQAASRVLAGECMIRSVAGMGTD